MSTKSNTSQDGTYSRSQAIKRLREEQDAIVKRLIEEKRREDKSFFSKIRKAVAVP